MANTIRIKRRDATGNAGSPTSLKNGELAYNENDNKLYYGFGDDGSGNATSIPSIGGTGNFVTVNTAQTITGVKTFNSTINGVGASLGTLACNTFSVASNKFTIANTGNTDIAGTLGVTGVTTLAALVNADGGIAVDTNKFTVADVTGNTVIAGTLSVAGTLDATGDLGVTGDQINLGAFAVTGIATCGSLLNANGGIAVDSNKFTVADVTGNTLIAGTLGVTGDTSLGTVSAGTWAATDVAVLHGGTGASTAAAARTNLGAASATDNSTDVTLIAGPGYLSLSGQEITAGVVALSTHTSGSYVASLTEGTGVTITGNVGAEGATPTIAIGQPVATTDDVTFDNITATGYLRGPAVFTIDPAAHGDDTGKVVIAGNLQVDGITTTINSTTVAIDDKNLRLADTASTSSVLNGAGIELGFDPNSPTALASGALVDFLYVHADSRMVLSSAMKITGNLQDTTLADCIIDGGTF